MRTHSDIVRDAGAGRIATLTDKTIHAVRSWQQRNSIPSEYWQKLIAADLTTADELIAAAARAA
ncbi:hypothetical protein [Tsuneonella sp. HG222]